MQVPPLPDIPEFLAGRAFVAIDGAYLGDEASAAELFAPLRALEPEMDSFGPMAPGGLSFIHMDPEGPTPGIGRPHDARRRSTTRRSTRSSRSPAPAPARRC